MRISVFIFSILLSYSMCLAGEIKEFNTLFVLNGDMDGMNINDKGDVVWYQKINDQQQLFYLSKDDMSFPINITENISNTLLNMGYKPVCWKMLGECTPWECEYMLDYNIDLAISWENRFGCFDDRGNVLVEFWFKDEQDGSFKQKLGVWNRKFGFRILHVPGVDIVTRVIFKENLFYISGLKNDVHVFTIAEIPDGNFWN